MKPVLAVMGILFGLIVICLIGVAYPRRQWRRHRERSGLNPRHVEGYIHRDMVNHNRGDKERFADHNSYRDVDKVALPGNIPVCSGDNCAESATRKQKNRGQKRQKGQGHKPRSLPQEDRRAKVPIRDSILDSISSHWGNSEKESELNLKPDTESKVESDSSKRFKSKRTSDSVSKQSLDLKKKRSKNKDELSSKSDELLSNDEDKKKGNRQTPDVQQEKSDSKKKLKFSKKRRNDLTENTDTERSTQRGDSVKRKSETPGTEPFKNTHYSAERVGNGNRATKQRRNNNKNIDCESEYRQQKDQPLHGTRHIEKISNSPSLESRLNDKSSENGQQDAPLKTDLLVESKLKSDTSARDEATRINSSHKSSRSSSQRLQKDQSLPERTGRRKGNRRKRIEEQYYDYDYDYGDYDDYGDYNNYDVYDRIRWPARRPIIYRLPPRRFPPVRIAERPDRRRNKFKPTSIAEGSYGRYVPIRRRKYRPIFVVRHGRRQRPIYNSRQKIRHTRKRKPGKESDSQNGNDDEKDDDIRSKQLTMVEEEDDSVVTTEAFTRKLDSKDTTNDDKHETSKEKKDGEDRKSKTTPLTTTQSTTLQTTTQATTPKTTATTKKDTTTSSTTPASSTTTPTPSTTTPTPSTTTPTSSTTLTPSTTPTPSTTTPTFSTTTPVSYTAPRSSTTTPTSSTTPTSFATPTFSTTLTSSTTLKKFESTSLSDVFSRTVPKKISETYSEVSEAETITLHFDKSTKVNRKNKKEKRDKDAKIVKSDSENYEEKKKSDDMTYSKTGKKKADVKLKSDRNQSFIGRRRQRERDRYRSHEVRRLRSKLAYLSEEIMISLESVLKALRSKVQVAYARYDGVLNRTRYDIIHGIQDGLYSIVNTNDDTYGIILDMSRLVRHIYRRAHEQHLINPSTRRRKVDQPVKQKDFRLAMRNAQQEYNKVMYTYNKAKQWKRRCGQMKRQKEELKHRLMKIQANYRLQELHYYSNRTVRKVQNLINYSMARRKLVYLRDTQTMASGLIMDATEYNRMAFDYVTDCTLEEWRCSDALRLVKEKLKRAVEIAQREKDTPAVEPTLSPQDKAMLRKVIDEAVQHTREQQFLKSVVASQLYPLVRLMKAAIEYKQRGQAGGNRPGQQPKPRDKRDVDLINVLKQITQKIDSALHKLRQRIEHRPSVDCVASGSGDDEDGDCLDGAEESGSGEAETSGNVLSSGETDDEDFVFVSPGTGHTTDWKYFESQLRKRTGSVKEDSKRLFKKATEMKQRVSELRGASRSGSRYDEADTLLIEWGDSRSRYEDIHQRVGKIVNTVRDVSQSVQAKVETVDKTVERVLGEVTGSGKGGGIFATVVQKVGESKSNMASIDKLRSVLPDVCGRVTQLRNNFRTNLTLLRQNIDRFKLITASINIPVSLSGGNYLEIPLKHDRNKTNMESFEFCVKRSSSDGIVAVIPGQDSNSVTVELKGGMLAMSVHGPDGDVLDSVTSPADVVVDKWYKIYLNRYGLKYKLTVQSLATTKAKSSQSAIVLNEGKPVLFLPSTLLIGGHPDRKTEKSFTGCIGDVRYGGRGVNIYRADNTGLHPPTCTSSCSSPSSLVFGGSGYLTFPAAAYSLRGSNTISFYFKTLQPNTLLFLLGSPREDIFLIASIEKGIVVVTMTTNGRTSSQRSVETSYSNGRFYHLLISFSTRGTQLSSVSMDGKTEAFTPENSAEFLSKYNLNYLTLGGVPTNTESYLKRNMSSFSGCMREFKINDKELLISDSQSGQGVSSGTCSAAVVSNCVKFSKKSKTIVLPEYEKGGHSLSFMFLASNPKGYILSYTRGERLDFSLRLTNKGIEVYNRLAKYGKTQSAPILMTYLWHYIHIWTDEKSSKILIQVDETDIREISFQSGWIEVYPDGAVTISLKSLPQDKQEDQSHFEGSIAQFIIDNSSVDLGVYAIPNNLDGCRIDSNPVYAQTTLTEGKV